jgi:hypothetical protein
MPSFKTKTSRKGSKNFAGESLEIIVYCGATSILPLNLNLRFFLKKIYFIIFTITCVYIIWATSLFPEVPDYGRNRTIYWVLIQSTHSPLESMAPSI